jgi:hypothetical protein
MVRADPRNGAYAHMSALGTMNWHRPLTMPVIFAIDVLACKSGKNTWMVLTRFPKLHVGMAFKTETAPAFCFGIKHTHDFWDQTHR